MKRLIAFLKIGMLVVLLAGCVAAYAPFAVPALVRGKLETVFPESTVRVGASRLGSGGVIISDISISRKGMYTISVDEIRVLLVLPDVLQGRIASIVLYEPRVTVQAPSDALTDLRACVQLQPGRSSAPPGVSRIEVVRGACQISSRDVFLDAFISCIFDPGRALFERLDVAVDQARMGDLVLKGISFSGVQGAAHGGFYAHRIVYSKLGIQGLKGAVSLDGNRFSLRGLRGKMLNGIVSVDAMLESGVPPVYQAAIRVQALDVARLMQDFELTGRVTATGTLSGTLAVKGRGAVLQLLSGTLTTAAPGGTFVITDPRLLQNMAHQANQPVDLVMESFRNYRYNKGTVVLSLEANDVGLFIHLDGDYGPRALDVILHDFL